MASTDPIDRENVVVKKFDQIEGVRANTSVASTSLGSGALQTIGATAHATGAATRSVGIVMHVVGKNISV